MSEKLRAKPAEKPQDSPKSELDRQLEKANGRIVNRLLGKLTLKLIGDPSKYGVDLSISPKVEALNKIRDAQDQVSEVDAQIEKASNSWRDRAAKKFGRFLLGKPETVGYQVRSKKVTELLAVKNDLQNPVTESNVDSTMPTFESTYSVAPDAAEFTASASTIDSDNPWDFSKVAEQQQAERDKAAALYATDANRWDFSEAAATQQPESGQASVKQGQDADPWDFSQYVKNDEDPTGYTKAS